MENNRVVILLAVGSIIFLVTSIMSYGPAVADQGALPDLTVTASRKIYSETFSENDHSWTISAGGPISVTNRSITIEVLDGASVNPSLNSSGNVDFSSMSSIVGNIITPQMSDEEKALAIWRFVMDNNYHGEWGTSFDGLEHLNVYGYGYCGTFASVLEPLWWTAGLRARHVNIGNHAATEVYYDNGWHYIDSHFRCYFLEKDNRTIASLDDLNNDPDLWDMRRQKKTSKRGSKKHYYMTLHPQEHGRAPEYSKQFTMAKGDTLTLTWQKAGKWCLARGAEGGNKPAPEPDIYANGIFKFYRNFSDKDQYRTGLLSSKNIDWDDVSSGYAHPLRAKEESYLIYEVRVPYFIPSTFVSGFFLKNNPEDLVSVDISVNNGATWSSLWTAEKTGLVKAAAFTDKTQEITTEKPWKYSYLLRIRMRAAISPNDIGAMSLESIVDLFYNPRSLPLLQKGGNELIFHDEGLPTHSVRVTYSWDEDIPVTLSEDTPLEDQQVRIKARIRNIGNLKAENIPVIFYNGDPKEGGIEIGREILKGIDPDNIGYSEISWKATTKNSGRSNNGDGVPIFIKIDPDNVIAESDKTNNTFVKSVRVLNPPDVSIPSPSFINFYKKDSSPDTLKISATVRNFSRSAWYGHYLSDHAEARNVIVRFFDGSPEGGKQIGSDQIIRRLLPLEHRAIAVDWVMSGLKGKHEIAVQVFPPENIVSALGPKAPVTSIISVDLDAYRCCSQAKIRGETCD